MDWSALNAELLQIVKAEAEGAFSAFKVVAKALETLAGLIARDMALSLRAGDDAWGEEARAQYRVLARIMAIRTNDVATEAAWETFERVIGLIAKVAKVAVVAAL